MSCAERSESDCAVCADGSSDRLLTGAFAVQRADGTCKAIFASRRRTNVHEKSVPLGKVLRDCPRRAAGRRAVVAGRRVDMAFVYGKQRIRRLWGHVRAEVRAMCEAFPLYELDPA